MQLIYDVAKNASNLTKHGIALSDALLVYNTPIKLTLKSIRNDEQRFVDVAEVPTLGSVSNAEAATLAYWRNSKIIKTGTSMLSKNAGAPRASTGNVL